MGKNTKLVIDILMLIGMFFSMSFHLYGAGTHKMIGLVTIVLFLGHNFLNRGWYRVLGKGTYTPLRRAHTLTNLLIAAAMVGMMVSGVLLSKELAAGAAHGAMTTGRMLHLLSSYGGCMGIALHIGFHLKGRTHHD